MLAICIMILFQPYGKISEIVYKELSYIVFTQLHYLFKLFRICFIIIFINMYMKFIMSVLRIDWRYSAPLFQNPLARISYITKVQLIKHGNFMWIQYYLIYIPYWIFSVVPVIFLAVCCKYKYLFSNYLLICSFISVWIYVLILLNQLQLVTILIYFEAEIFLELAHWGLF